VQELDRPKNRYFYDTPDIFDHAAAYAFGIAKNHPFFDGNKRVSLVVSETFLLLNGVEITAKEDEMLAVWLGLADDRMGESKLAEWFRRKAI
jgi:death-on-curing protein